MQIFAFAIPALRPRPVPGPSSSSLPHSRSRTFLPLALHMSGPLQNLIFQTKLRPPRYFNFPSSPGPNKCRHISPFHQRLLCVMRPRGKFNFRSLTICVPRCSNFPQEARPGKGDHFFARILTEKTRMTRRKSLIIIHGRKVCPKMLLQEAGGR